MKEMKFSVEIDAAKEIVWDILWRDETFREWASIIDPETYMVGELKQGNEVQFISAHGGYGVTSLVEEIIPNEFLLLRHNADTQDEGARSRENEWTGGAERYSLVEHEGVTTLTTSFDVPTEMLEYFEEAYPRALGRVKELAEKTK